MLQEKLQIVKRHSARERGEKKFGYFVFEIDRAISSPIRIFENINNRNTFEKIFHSKNKAKKLFFNFVRTHWCSLQLRQPRDSLELVTDHSHTWWHMRTLAYIASDVNVRKYLSTNENYRGNIFSRKYVFAARFIQQIHFIFF